VKAYASAHCEGIRNPVSSSEFKHGPLSAVHDGYPVVFITAPGDEMMMINPVLRNRNEVTTRGR
jgi:glucosamine 6-phosphate synthetase-like amidotransferase/phosphosugar isomerase protein